MISAPRLHRISVLALPIIGAMMSQNLLNLVDTAMVGHLGPTALAAVGIGGFANFIAISTIIGLSSGVQAMAARRKGEGRTDELAVPLNGGLFLAFVIGVPISIGLIFAAPYFFPLLNADPGVIADGTPYLQARLMAVVFVGLNFSYRGYFNGVGQSGIYLRTILVMHAANIAFNYVLIFGRFGFPELGAEGAGIGTALSVVIGTVLYSGHAYRVARPHGFLHRIPKRDTMMAMVRLAVPSGLQQLLFASGMTAFFWIIGQIGVDELAVSNVMITLILVAFLPAMALGIAALTLVSETLGQGNAADAKRWGWDVAKVGAVLLGVIGLAALIFPDLILSGFLHEPHLIALGRVPLQLAGASMVFEGVGMVLLNALLGAGAARYVMAVSVSSQWLIGLPLAYLVGPYLGMGLTWIWITNAGYRILQTGVFAVLWQRGAWAAIKL